MTNTGPAGRRRIGWGVAVAVVAVVCGAVGVRWGLSRPGVVLLTSDGPADWVRVDRPFNLYPRSNQTTRAAFVAGFDVPAGFAGGAIDVRATGGLVALVDKVKVFDSGGGGAAAGGCQVPLAAGLTVGPHRLRLEVTAEHGPALVRGRCDAVGLRTGADGWKGVEVPAVGPAGWQAAVPVTRTWEPAIADAFDPVWREVGRRSPALAVLFAAGCGGYLWVTRRSPASPRPDPPTGSGGGVGRWPRAVKWGVIGLWVVLAGNNLSRLPPSVGYDVAEHLQYVRYVADHWRVPLPTEGWEFFHPPVFYFCAAAAYRVLSAAGYEADWAATLLRAIPLACGVVMVELCYRAARHAFPGRPDLAAVAAVVGGLLPMNLYMAQAVSNEPLAACLAGGAGVVAMGLIAGGGPAADRRWRVRLGGLGLLLGVAVLTKASGVLWLAPVAVAVGVAAARRAGSGAGSGRAGVTAAAGVLAVAVLAGGWYFVRNRAETGQAFWTHSYHAKGGAWWQDPGYRTPADFYRFGRSLARPAYAGVPGVWDSLYGTLWGDGMLNGIVQAKARPPFDYGWVSCGLWLGLPLTLLGGVGLVRGGAGGAGSGPVRFAAAVVLLYVAALLAVALTVPIYSAVKASYALAATPCLAVLVAAGFDRVTPTRATRAVGVGLLTCSAAAAWLAYFVTAA